MVEARYSKGPWWVHGRFHVPWLAEMGAERVPLSKWPLWVVGMFRRCFVCV